MIGAVMVERRKVANPLALVVLAELLVGPMHPYEIGRRLTEHGKDRNIKYTRGSLYMVVEQLERAGFVAEHETVRDTSRPERTLYALTDQGRGELYEWLRELVAEPRDEYPHFGVALSLLSVLPPLEAAELLGARLAALTEEIEVTRAGVRAATEGGLAWVFLVEEEYRLAVSEAERGFVERVAESLRDPAYIKEWTRVFGEIG